MNVIGTFIIGCILFVISIDAYDDIDRNSVRSNLPTESESDLKIIVDDIITNELSISSVSRPSSKCWMSSITAMDRIGSHKGNTPFTSGSSYCAAMTEDQLDLLALELMSCELAKARRDMFVDQSNHDSITSYSSSASGCTLGSSNSLQPYQTSSCLELLTDHAHSIYHQIRLHTKSLCNRLADEMFQRQKEETTQLLALQIEAVLKGTASTMEQLHVQSTLLQNQSHLLKEQQTDLEQMYEVRKREEINQSLLMKEHRHELEQMYETRKREEAEADRARKQREESVLTLLHHQSDLMKSQQIDFQDLLKAKEELLEEKVKERMMQLEQMKEMIATAQSQIRPLSKIESYVKLATDGFDIFKSILNFFVSMNVVWILTSLPLVSQAKRRLYGVLVLGFIAEILAILYADSELLDQLGEIDVIITVRYWTRGCCLAVWLISCLISCICPSQDDTDQYVSRMEALLSSQMDFVSQVNAAHAEGMLVTQRQAKEENMDRGRSVRKYRPSSRRSSSKATRSPKTVVTPHRSSTEKPKHTREARTHCSRKHDTIKILKEMQRGHVDSDTESSDESSSSHGDSNESSIAHTSSKRGRKRKFSETGDGTQNAIVLHTSKHDDGSVSSTSTESLSSKADPKKYKTTEPTM